MGRGWPLPLQAWGSTKWAGRLECRNAGEACPLVGVALVGVDMGQPRPIELSGCFLLLTPF